MTTIERQDQQEEEEHARRRQQQRGDGPRASGADDCAHGGTPSRPKAIVRPDVGMAGRGDIGYVRPP